MLALPQPASRNKHEQPQPPAPSQTRCTRETGLNASCLSAATGPGASPLGARQAVSAHACPGSLTPCACRGGGDRVSTAAPKALRARMPPRPRLYNSASQLSPPSQPHPSQRAAASGPAPVRDAAQQLCFHGKKPGRSAPGAAPAHCGGSLHPKTLSQGGRARTSAPPLSGLLSPVDSPQWQTWSPLQLHDTHSCLPAPRATLSRPQ